MAWRKLPKVSGAPVTLPRNLEALLFLVLMLGYLHDSNEFGGTRYLQSVYGAIRPAESNGPLPFTTALERLIVEPWDFLRFLESVILDRFNPSLKFHGDVSWTLPNLFFRLLRQEDGCDHNLIVHLKGELLKKYSTLFPFLNRSGGARTMFSVEVI